MTKDNSFSQVIKARFTTKILKIIIIISVIISLLPGILLPRNALSIVYIYYLGIISFTLPGFILVEFFLCKTINLDKIERGAISIGLSILVTSLFVFTLSISPWKTYIWSLTLLQVGFATLSCVLYILREKITLQS